MPESEDLLKLATRFGYSSACVSRWRHRGITPTIRRALKRCHDLETRSARGKLEAQQQQMDLPPPVPQLPLLDITITSEAWSLNIDHRAQATGFIHTSANSDRIAEAFASILISLNRNGPRP